MTSLVKILSEKFYRILIIEKEWSSSWWRPADGLDNIAVAAEGKYFVNFTKSRKKYCLIYDFLYQQFSVWWWYTNLSIQSKIF